MRCYRLRPEVLRSRERDGVMQRPNAALSANSATADSSTPFYADSSKQPSQPPLPDQTWRVNQGLHLQRQLVQLCEQNNIDFSRSAMLHSFEPQVETVYQLWCTQTRIKGLCFLGICALTQSVVRWVETWVWAEAHDPATLGGCQVSYPL